MWTRRRFVGATAGWGAAAALASCPAAARPDEAEGVEVNDVQSQLNATRMHRVLAPRTLDDLEAALWEARRDSRTVSVCGGRHSMGGQQFGTDSVLVDLREFNRVVSFDADRGLVEVEAGIQWPELIDYLHREQAGHAAPWAIRQKQSGVDRVTIAGSLASNIHGRQLRWPPLVSEIESFALLDAGGKPHTCSRRQNAELFSLAIGGYGLFGLVTHVTLRLVRRTKVQRVVEVIAIQDLLPWYERRLEEGFLYGDCQYATDLANDATAHQGVFSCYLPVDDATPMPASQKQFSADDWADLYRLARTDKRRAFERYAEYYVSTTGQVYWSDTHQLAGDFDAYREAVDPQRGTEMITEVYIPRENFLDAMAQARRDFLDHEVDMTYGTIRFIQRDEETFLAWAREPYVCIVCNLHVRHTVEGIEKAAADFRRIIDRAIQFGGRYYLTYHRFATREQVVACYPQFVDFLRLKRKYDPQELFQSDWYRHHRTMFADAL